MVPLRKHPKNPALDSRVILLEIINVAVAPTPSDTPSNSSY
jgi:hypothetical protein